MSDETKKVEQIEQQSGVSELSEKDLNDAAGGVSGNDGGCIPNPLRKWPPVPPTLGL